MAHRKDRSIQVSRTVDAPVERVFALLADPDRHRDLDGTGMIQRSHRPGVLTELGEVFVMDMHSDGMGDYRVENHVVVYEPDAAIGWAPASSGEQPAGHTFIYRLTPDGSGRTVVNQTYDWSASPTRRHCRTCRWWAGTGWPLRSTGLPTRSRSRPRAVGPPRGVVSCCRGFAAVAVGASRSSEPWSAASDLASNCEPQTEHPSPG